MSEGKAIEIHEMVDLQDNPARIYAEGHHDQAEFLAALRDWERELCGETRDLYGAEDVRHEWLGVEVLDEEGEFHGEEVYVAVDADHPDALPVTFVWTV